MYDSDCEGNVTTAARNIVDDYVKILNLTTQVNKGYNEWRSIDFVDRIVIVRPEEMWQDDVKKTIPRRDLYYCMKMENR